MLGTFLSSAEGRLGLDSTEDALDSIFSRSLSVSMLPQIARVSSKNTLRRAYYMWLELLPAEQNQSLQSPLS